MCHNTSMLDFNWYQTLNLPALSPPAWIFSPVWTCIYALIILSLVLFVIKKSDKNKTGGYILYILQLLVNLAWTPVFFGMKNIEIALLLIIVLDVLVFWNIVFFKKVSKLSGYLLVPYFLWILFATDLNFGILALN